MIALPKGKPLTGIDQVLRNLNREIAGIKKRSKTGLIRGGLLVKRRAQQDTPVEFANLNNSAYVAWKGGPVEQANFRGPQADILSQDHAPAVLEEQGQLRDLQVAVGYTAFYGVYVHERMELKHTVGKAKFLEDALKRSEKDILRMVAEEAKIP